MISGDWFCGRLRAHGVGFASGVPCSFFAPLINAALQGSSVPYFGATNEGEAVSAAAGAWLAGVMPVAMFQNSGLGNAVNPLTSLHAAFDIPTLLIVSWRGEPGVRDEPQHELMGRITRTMLESMEIPTRRIEPGEEAADIAIREALDTMARTRRPAALLMPKGTMEECEASSASGARRPEPSRIDRREGRDLPSRMDILGAFVEITRGGQLTVATTGKCARELYTLRDSPAFFYQVGSMGCASAIGLGIAMNTRKRVFVLDGDGSFLMRMGTGAAIGIAAPPGLVHVVLDNGAHDSTGGQGTGSERIDFGDIAAGCRYRHVFACDTVAGFAGALELSMKRRGPHFIHVRIRPGSIQGLRRIDISPKVVAERFRERATGEDAGARWIDDDEP